MTQSGLDGSLDLRRDFNGFHALRQRPALASLRDDAVLALDLGDIRRGNLQALLLQHPRLDRPVVGGIPELDAGERLVVQVDIPHGFS